MTASDGPSLLERVKAAGVKARRDLATLRSRWDPAQPFELQPQPRVPYGRLIEVREAFGPSTFERIEEMASERQPGAIRSYDALGEYYARLHFRYLDLKVAESEVKWVERPPVGFTLHEAQLRCLDDFEAFHQHVYASLSALAHILVKLVGPDVPTSSVTKLLRYLRGRLDGVERQLDLLDASRAYRAKHVDHPQQTAVHTWMTCRISDVDEVYFIYYQEASGRSPAMQRPPEPSLDPRDPNFIPPMDVAQWELAPSASETYTALLEVTECALDGRLWSEETQFGDADGNR